MYVFVRTEQYFNLDALKIVRAENEKITDEFAVDDLFYMSKDFISKCNKIAKQTVTEISENEYLPPVLSTVFP